jgi:hypothetical protein
LKLIAWLEVIEKKFRLSKTVYINGIMKRIEITRIVGSSMTQVFVSFIVGILRF